MRVTALSHACSLYNNIKAPSQLQPSATYYLFKDNIDPKWEHPKNAQGGCWTANVPKTPNAKQTLDAWWLHAVSGGHDGTAGHASVICPHVRMWVSIHAVQSSPEPSR